jgi:asparagine synthase (glutamine-hydrolysing)
VFTTASQTPQRSSQQPRTPGTSRAQLTAVFPAPTGAAAPAAGAPLNGELPAQLTLTGRFRAGELRSFACHEGTIVTVGQCLATRDQLVHDARQALATGRLENLTRWPGSYLLLVVRPGDLTAFADPAEQYPLYYRHTAGRTFLSTLPAGAAAGHDYRPDTTALAAHIFCPDIPLLPDTQSLVSGVRRLPAGQALRATSSGHLTSWQYEHLLPRPDRLFPEAAEHLAQVLDQAVRLRAHTSAGQLTTDFSGGLDSTSLAFLALRHLPDRLPAFTYRRPGSSCDDPGYAQRFAALAPRLTVHDVIGDEHTLPYLGLRPPAGAEPNPAAASLARTRLRLEHIARLGGGIHLGGEGGDALFTPAPSYLAALISHRRPHRAARDAYLLARSRYTSPATAILKAARLAGTSPATALHRTADLLEQQPTSREPSWCDALTWWPDPGPEQHWLTASARRALATAARARAADHRPGTAAGPADHAALREVRTAAAAQRWLDAEATEFGLWPQAPFLDAEVVRACLALPAHLRAAPPAVKPLLQAATRTQVPAPVFARRTKGDYTDEDYQGVRAAHRHLRALLATSRLADLGIIEPREVSASLDRALSGVRAPTAALNRLLGAELWLRGSPWR